MFKTIGTLLKTMYDSRKMENISVEQNRTAFRVNSFNYKYKTKGPYHSHERMAKRLLDRLFHPLKFEKVKLDVMRNPLTKRKLELDLYCKELKVAVECDGEYHSVYSAHYHKSMAEFDKQRERDKIKDWLCKQNGIKLVRVPYNLSFDSLEDYLINEISTLM